MDQGTGDSAPGQSTPVTDSMDQGTGDSAQGQSTPVTGSMDQGTGDSAQGQSTPLPDDFAIKLEPPWSMEEGAQDQPSAVYSTVQPMSDSTSGSLLSVNAIHTCQHCSAVFELSRSLELHMETFHGKTLTLHSELPVVSRLHDSASENADKELKPAWSIKEEPPDQPLTVCSPVQPMSDNTSGSLLSLNSSPVCQRCSATFVLFSSLEIHMVAFHGETLYDFFPTYSAFYCFDAAHHCGSETDNAGNLNKQGVKGRQDKVENTGRTGLIPVKPYTCDDCGVAFSHTYLLKRHRGMHTGERPYMYIDCEKGVADISRLKDRPVTHTGEKAHLCTDCGKRFVWSSSLKKHRLTHTGEKPHVCTDCGRGFTESGTLKSHQKTHTGEKPHVCTECGKAFAQLSSLKRHYLTHTDEKPYTCDICGMAFSWTSQLTIHKRIHTGEEPFVCPDCGKGFAQSSHLKRHHLTHTGKKPYMCTVCGKGFAQPSHLKRHHLTHTGEEPYVCTDCGKGFAQSSNLKRHQLTHTGEKP